MAGILPDPTSGGVGILPQQPGFSDVLGAHPLTLLGMGAALMGGQGLGGAFQNAMAGLNAERQQAMQGALYNLVAQKYGPAIGAASVLAPQAVGPLMELQKPMLGTPGSKILYPNAPGSQPATGAQQPSQPSDANTEGMMTPDTLKALATRYRQGDTTVLQNFPRGTAGAMMLAQLQNEIQRQNAEAGDTTNSLATNRGNFQNVGDTIKAFGGSGKQGQQVRSFDVATAHLAVLRDLATQMGNGNFTPTNAIKAEFRRITGSDLPTNVEAAKQIVSAEVAKAVQGSDVSEGDRERLQDPLKTANSFQQLAGVIDKVYMPLMGGQLSGLRQQYLINTGDKPENFDRKLSPATQQLLQQPAQQAPQAQPQIQAPQEGATATNPRTGQKIILKGGQWVPLR